MYIFMYSYSSVCVAVCAAAFVEKFAAVCAAICVAVYLNCSFLVRIHNG